jgi:Flp pilus assembly pilin Flp
MPALRNLLRDQRGVMAIETVVVAPVLALMALGTFEAGTMVSRQQELMSAAAEAEGIILSTSGGGVIDLPGWKTVIETSLDPAGTREHLEVELENRLRCGSATDFMAEGATCAEPQQTYQYVVLTISDRYDPVWTRFGISAGMDYNITRTIQVK